MQLALAETLPWIKSDPTGLITHNLELTLNTLNSPSLTSASYTCIKDAILKMMCDSQLTSDGEWRAGKSSMFRQLPANLAPASWGQRMAVLRAMQWGFFCVQ